MANEIKNTSDDRKGNGPEELQGYPKTLADTELITQLVERGLTRTDALQLLNDADENYVAACIKEWDAKDERQVTDLRDGIKKKLWTMFVYMAGDNNLTEEMVWGLQEMKHTLETDDEINNKVGVIAQYDASGRNPCILRLNKNRGVSKGLDGELDEKKVRTINSQEVYEKVRERLEPTREHFAIAVYHEAGIDVMELVESVANQSMYGMNKDQAAKFVDLLMTCDNATKQLLLDYDIQTLAWVLAQAKQEHPNLTEATQVAQACCGLVGALLKKLDALAAVPAVKELAARIAKSSDCVIRNTRDLSSPLMIQDFVEEQMKLLDSGNIKLRARYYIVVLSGHGGGATGDFLPDEDPQTVLTIPKLGEMLRSARSKLMLRSPRSKLESARLPILGMDSCLMSMAEVGYEVQDSVDYLVGSEGYVANTGWPYHRILEVLAKAKTADFAVEKIVEKYAAFYQDYEMGGLSTHLAAIRLAQIGTPDRDVLEEWNQIKDSGREEMEGFFSKYGARGKLATTIRLLADNLKEALHGLADDEEQQELGEKPSDLSGRREVRNALILAHWYAQSFKLEKYVDLWDFCDQLLRFLPQAGQGDAIRQCCEAVKAGIDRAVQRSCYCGPDFQHTHGISVFFPWSRKDFSIEYGDLRFAQETHWYDFLDVYLSTTQRLKRAHNRDAVPFRLESDFEQFIHRTGSPFGTRTGSPFGTRTGSPFGTRTGSPFGTRTGSPFGTRTGSPFGTRMEGGKNVFQTNVKNSPDGFFRQDTETKNRFKDAAGRLIDRNGRFINDKENGNQGFSSHPAGLPDRRGP